MEIARVVKKNQKEIKLFKILLVIFFILLAGRLFQLQILKGDYHQKQAELNMIREIPVSAPRGNIYDRQGRILVKNIPSFSIYVLPAEIENLTEVIHTLSSILKINPIKLKKILNDFARNSLEKIKIKEHLDPVNIARISEIEAELPGVYIEAEPIRYYPEKDFASHLLGYVGEITREELDILETKGYHMGDILGKDGIEFQYDCHLRGKDGVKKLQVDVQGRVVSLLEEIEPVSGEDLYLTIDKDLQRAAEESLSSVVKKITLKNSQPCAGSVIAIDPETGEILAMVNLPQFDPNLFSRGISEKAYRNLITHKLHPLLNRAIACSFPCGSTFKLITGSASLQEGLVAEHSVFNCPGVFYLNGIPFFCFLKSGHGALDFIHAIAYSCDVVFYKLGYALGIERLHRYASSFGIGEKTGIDLPGETGGLLPDENWKEKTYHEPWFGGDTVNLSIGQGYLGVTPLQLAIATTAVINGGNILRPFLLKKITTRDGSLVKENKPFNRKKVLVEPENLEVLKKGMRGAVLYGTATAANSPLVSISGKTGTAENLPCPENPHGRNHVWFTSFAPYDNPRIVVCVFLEQSGGYGGQWAVPVARNIIEAYIAGKKVKKLNNLPESKTILSPGD